MSLAAVLCSGVGGAELALEALGCEIAWHAEIDQDAVAVHTAHWPDVPNVGDITTADWSTVPPVDLIHASYPCQPFSQAGQREGHNDARNLWPAVRDAITALRPRWVTLENVPGHISLGLLAVLGDLAALGFDAEWGVLGSHSIGGCHRRDRLWVVAADASIGAVWPSAFAVAGGGDPLVAGLDRASAAADAVSLLPTPRVAATRTSRSAAVRRDSRSAPSLEQALEIAAGRLPREFATWDELPRSWQPTPLLPTPTAADGRGGPGNDGRDGGYNLRTAVLDFGRYQAVIDRWASIFGPPPEPAEPAPRAKAGRRLAAPFPEWMMGFPAGWVTDHVVRTAALRCIGNAVQPQTATVAYRQLITRHIARQQEAES